ncbi:unnamed protein product [Lampetra fluviatilis]
MPQGALEARATVADACQLTTAAPRGDTRCHERVKRERRRGRRRVPAHHGQCRAVTRGATSGLSAWGTG